MLLVGFAMEIYYDARPCERQIFARVVVDPNSSSFERILLQFAQSHT